MSDHPKVIAPPPLILLAALAAAFVTHHFKPLRFHPDLATYVPAGLLILAGFCFGAWAVIAQVRRGTHVEPYKPTTALVVTGPYQISRNPIYLGLLFIYLGISLCLRTFWPFLYFPLLVLILHFGVVRPEETYLAAKFGGAYRIYCQNTRRWL
jgi:protein-S-isoprenylcysteine O-methyltransferase Ste14